MHQMSGAMQQARGAFKIRSACEACHERKQRCIVHEGESSCQACQTSSRQCFFKLRSKAGRPPRRQRDQWSQANAPLALTPKSMAPLDANFPEQTDEAYASALESMSMGDMQQPYTSLGTVDSSSSKSSLGPDVVVPDLTDESPMMLTDLYDPTAFVSTASLRSLDAQTCTDPMIHILESLLILRRFNQAMKYSAQFITRLPPRDHYETIMATVKGACNQSVVFVTASTGTRSDHSAFAVILALVIEIFELCEATITAGETYFNNNPTRQHFRHESGSSDGHSSRPRHGSIGGHTSPPALDQHIDFALLLKELDVHLTQTWICETRVVRTLGVFDFIAATEKRAELNRRISSLMDQAFA